MSQSLNYYALLLRRYWRSTVAPRDFCTLLRVRLSQSKIGSLVCPSPIVVTVRIAPYGGEVVLRSHTTDISVNDELLVSDGYAALHEHVDARVQTIVDLGANTGLAARWMLQAFPGARVLAVEPEPSNIAVLQRNAVGHAIQVAPVAVGSCARDAQLHTNSGEHGFTMVGAPGAGDEAITVPVERLDALLAQAGVSEVDLLKVDIEGAEVELFSDCGTWISSVRWILVECHAGFTVKELMAMLQRQGGEFTVVHQEPKSEWDFEVALLQRVVRHASSGHPTRDEAHLSKGEEVLG